MASSVLRFLDHTQRTTVGRTPLDEWLARHTHTHTHTHTHVYCFHLFIPLHGLSNQVAELPRKHNVCIYRCLHMRAGVTQRSRCSYLLPDPVLSGVTALPMNMTFCRQSHLLTMLARLVSINYQTWVCNPSNCSLLVVRCPDVVGISSGP
jgi:hypothetical protein